MRYLVFVLLVVPLPAFALSCLPHGVSDAFLEARAAEEGYVPVLGDLDFDADLVPEVDWNNQQNTPGQTLIPARFKGDALTMRGVPLAFETDVVLEVRCFGPWCPSPRPGHSLAFLRKAAQGYVLSTTACGGFLFGQPTDAQVNEVRDCLSARRCAPSVPR